MEKHSQDKKDHLPCFIHIVQLVRWHYLLCQHIHICLLKNFHYRNIKCPVLNGASWNTLQGIVLSGNDISIKVDCLVVLQFWGLWCRRKKEGLARCRLERDKQSIHSIRACAAHGVLGCPQVRVELHPGQVASFSTTKNTNTRNISCFFLTQTCLMCPPLECGRKPGYPDTENPHRR